LIASPLTVSLFGACDVAALRRARLFFWGFVLLTIMGGVLVWLM
jgi:hypothetical protein